MQRRRPTINVTRRGDRWVALVNGIELEFDSAVADVFFNPDDSMDAMIHASHGVTLESLEKAGNRGIWLRFALGVGMPANAGLPPEGSFRVNLEEGGAISLLNPNK